MFYLEEIYQVFKKWASALRRFKLILAFYFYLVSELVDYDAKPCYLTAIHRKSDIKMKPDLVEMGSHKLVKQLRLNKEGKYPYRSKHRITLQCDITTDGEKYSSKKAGKVYKNWDNNLGKVIKTHTIVLLSFQIGFGKHVSRYVLDFRVKDKRNNKSYAEYVKEILTSLKSFLETNGCDLSLIVLTFDSSFSWLDDIEALDRLGFQFVGKFHHRKRVQLDNKSVVITNWLQSKFYIKDFKEIENRYSSSIQHWHYYRWLKFSSNPKFKVMLFLGNMGKGRKRKRLLLITNMKGRSYITILERWLCRWSIETIFKEENGSLGWSGYQRHTSALPFENHIAWCCMKYNTITDYKVKHHLREYGVKRILRKIRMELAEYRLSEIIEWVSKKIHQDLLGDKFL